MGWYAHVTLMFQLGDCIRPRLRKPRPALGCCLAGIPPRPLRIPNDKIPPSSGGNSGFVLGLAGAAEPAIYNLQSLNVNGNSTFTVVGPVLITMANGGSLNGSMGSAGHPEWLNLDIASGGLTLNGNVTFN